MADIHAGIGLLTRIPVRVDVPAATERGARGAWAWPIVGLVVGFLATFIAAVAFWLGMSASLSAAIALAALAMLTGALHEDGLADSLDGLWGGHTRERRLQIMKDSRIGTYGALALILSVALRVAALAILIETLPPLAMALAWLATAILGRCLMVWHWSDLPSARPDGVAGSAGAPDPEATRIALILGSMLTAGIGLFALPFHAWFAASLIAVGTVAAFTRHCRKRIGGQTGDTIGASEQLCEIAFLITLAIIL